MSEKQDEYEMPVEILVYCPYCNNIMDIKVTTKVGTIEIEPFKCKCEMGKGE